MSNTKPRLQKETIGSYSFAVIGILLFSTLAIFVGSTLGVIAFDHLSENSNISALPISVESQYMLECNKPEDILDTVIKAKPGLDESVYQYVQNPKHHLVEEGVIEFVKDSFVDDLPICMSVEYGMDQWVVLRVKGGYLPELQDYLGNPLYSAYGLMTLTDKFGNTEYGAMGGSSVGLNVHRILADATGLRGEFQIGESLPMCAMDRAVSSDVVRATGCGGEAVRLAENEESGFMVTIERDEADNFTYGKAPLSDVAVKAKEMPAEMINNKGNDVTDAFLKYARPLVGLMPAYVSLEE